MIDAHEEATPLFRLCVAAFVSSITSVEKLHCLFHFCVTNSCEPVKANGEPEILFLVPAMWLNLQLQN